uniref:THAP domain-containing protein 1 n=1 Tax=Cyprinus carpio TaxID=7962 RepID=A0A8C1YKA3_CYPCA
MVYHCCAYNCKNISRNKSLSFHKFPLKDPNLLKKWLNNLRWKDWKPAPNSKICSIHFEKKCLIEDGKRTRLHSWAVPTIFSFPNRYLERKVKINPRSRRALGIAADSNSSGQAAPDVTAETSQKSNSEKPEHRTTESLQPNTSKSSSSQMRTEPMTVSTQPLTEPEKSPPWTILGDEALDRSMTIPSFFHSGYCLPDNIRWAGDDDLNIMPHVAYGVLGQMKPHIIEVKERWEWLGLDVRGPFSPTVDRHTHIMTLTDYHSKWVEAFPLTQNLSQDVAKCLAEVINQQGYPLGILSRLPKRILMEVNRELKKHLRLNSSALVIHHRQTGYMDLVTESLLNEMLDELVKKHGSIWHILLPAATLRLCCTNHPTTKEKPFTRMCASDPPFSSTPRELPYSATDVRLSSFVIPATVANDLGAVSDTSVHSLKDQIFSQ